VQQTNVDCQTHPATDAILSVAIPDAQPLPYTFNQRSHYANYASFKDPSCWYEGKNGVTSGTIYQAGANGSTHVEGDVTIQHNSFDLRCGNACVDPATARFRFNLPL